MADHYSPSGSRYDTARRASSPGRLFDRDRLPPGCPTGPSRSFSSIDPRRANYNQKATDSRMKKRIASQSPDGGQARKQHRQDQRQLNPSTSNSESRHSPVSYSNSMTRPPKSSNQTPQSRRPSVQSPGGLRKPSDAPALISPRSPADSGDSTPQQKPSSLSKDTALQKMSGAANLRSDSSTGPNLLSDLLENFSTGVASCAALEQDMKLAEAHYSRAQREYNEHKKHFTQFPSIQERKEADKDNAYKALQSKKQLLTARTTTHQVTLGDFAALLGQVFQQQSHQRAEYDALQKNYVDLKEEVTTLKGLRQDINEVKKTAEEAAQSAKAPTFQRDIETVKGDNTTLFKWKQQADERIRELKSFEQRVSSVEALSNTTKKIFDDFQNKEVTQSARKQQVNDLETSYESLSQKIGGLQKNQAKAAAENLNAQALAKKLVENSCSNDGLQKLKTDYATLAKEVTSLQKLRCEQADLKNEVNSLKGQGEAFFKEIEEKTTKTISTHDDLAGLLDDLGKDIVETKETLGAVKESIEEDGKDPIVKRVKMLDILVNNLFSKIQDDSKAPLVQRVKQLEKEGQSLQAELRAAQSTGELQPLRNPTIQPIVANTNVLETRVTNIEKELGTFNEEQREKDKIVGETIDIVRNDLSGEIRGLQAERVQYYNSFNTGLQQVVQDFSAMQTTLKSMQGTVDATVSKETVESLRGEVSVVSEQVKNLQASHGSMQSTVYATVSKETVESLRGEVSAVSEQIKNLQVSHERAKSVSRTPQANGPPQFSPQFQQTPNGIVGSPQINGGQQQSSPYASHAQGQGYPQEASDQSANHDVQAMRIQLEGLIAVTQQLKMRCDNLQSDDVVRAMVAQISTMYPDAKLFNATVQEFRIRYASLEQQVSSLLQRKAPLTSDANLQEIQRLWEGVNTTKEALSVLKSDLGKGKAESEKAKKEVDQNLSSAGKSAEVTSRVNEEVKTLREELTKTTKTAIDAAALSKQHASRLSKVQPEDLKTKVTAFEGMIAALEGRVEEHSQKLVNGEKLLEGLQLAAAQGKSDSESMKKRVGALKGKVDKIEEVLED